MNFVPRALRDEQGVAFAAFAVFASAVLGLASIGLGTGLLFLVHNEAQNASDAGALAGVEAMYFESSVNLEAGNAVKANALTGGVENPGAASATDANIVSIRTGNYTPGGGFVSALPPEDAVEVVVSTDLVPFLRAGVPSTVTTRSVAWMSGRTSIPPGGSGGLPIVLGDCHFNPNSADGCFPGLGEECIPPMQRVAGPQQPQTAFTSFFTTGGQRAVRRLVPIGTDPICSGACQAAGANQQEIVAQQQISLVESVNSLTLDCISKCLYPPGADRTSMVPVVSCQLGSTATVLGFALVEVTSIDTSMQGGINLRVLKAPPEQTGGGAPPFGLPVITLVE